MWSEYLLADHQLLCRLTLVFCWLACVLIGRERVRLFDNKKVVLTKLESLGAYGAECMTELSWVVVTL